MILRMALSGFSVPLRIIAAITFAAVPLFQLEADPIFSNISTAIPPGSGLIAGPTADNGIYLADAFEFSPTTSATFADAIVDVWTLASNGPDSNVTAAIYSADGSGGAPGTLLDQLNTATAPRFDAAPNLAFSSNETLFTQVSGSPVSLTAGTEYWLALAPADPTSFLYVAAGGATSDVAIAQQSPTSTSAWTNPIPGQNVQFEIDGTAAVSTPEPASFLLATSALLVCLFACRAQRAQKTRN